MYLSCKSERLECSSGVGCHLLLGSCLNCPFKGINVMAVSSSEGCSYLYQAHLPSVATKKRVCACTRMMYVNILKESFCLFLFHDKYKCIYYQAHI